MIKKILNIILNRNLILICSIIFGIAFGEFTQYIKPYSLLVLAIIMTFSMTGISTKELSPIKSIIKPSIISIIAAYAVFPAVLILLSFFTIKDNDLFNGMLVIAASPPGIAVIPFTHTLKGSMKYSMIGIFSTYLASIVLTPLLILSFSNAQHIDVWQIFTTLVYVIIIPFIISRFLLAKNVKKQVEHIRGRIVDIGIGIIIFTAIGINKNVFIHPNMNILIIFVLLFIVMFALGELHLFIAKKMAANKKETLSLNLLLTLKSSGFTVSTSLIIFGDKASIPSAVLSVMVTIYLLYISVRMRPRKSEKYDIGI